MSCQSSSELVSVGFGGVARKRMLRKAAARGVSFCRYLRGLFVEALEQQPSVKRNTFDWSAFCEACRCPECRGRHAQSKENPHAQHQQPQQQHHHQQQPHQQQPPPLRAAAGPRGSQVPRQPHAPAALQAAPPSSCAVRRRGPSQSAAHGAHKRAAVLAGEVVSAQTPQHAQREGPEAEEWRPLKAAATRGRAART